MRIITGIYKGRRFDIPRTFKARPTTDFAKESIFNVIGGYLDLEGCTALDLFSGTGGIALEMASRGCSQVVSVEADRDHHAFIRRCVDKIGCRTCVPVRADVFRFVKSCHTRFDLVFADPPYDLENIVEIPALVLEGGVLREGGLFVFEHGKRNDFSLHPRFIEHRSYGSVNFSLFR